MRRALGAMRCDATRRDAARDVDISQCNVVSSA
jgi:hypothetical protein